MSEEAHTPQEIQELPPEAQPGTPDAAVDEALKAPIRVNITKRREGNRIRAAGLWCRFPDELGGGRMRIRPATVTAVQQARAAYEKKIRQLPAVKRHFGPKDDLEGKAGYEILRYTFIMSLVEWDTTAVLEIADRELNPRGLNPEELRGLLEATFLPTFDLTTDAAPEDELDMEFLNACLDFQEAVRKEPAERIADVGKDFEIGVSALVDYRDSAPTTLQSQTATT